MKIEPTALPDVLLIRPQVFGDERGFFMETFHEAKMAAQGLRERFVQDNLSRSVKGALRGLHFQNPRGQGKLVRVVAGAVFDVAVDVRRGSPTFGRWVAQELSAENKLALYVPPGFAHGFCVLSESADFFYKCTDFYAPEHEHGILWNDPDIGIAWPVRDPILSAKDSRYPRLASLGDELPCYLPGA
ncbi:MAG TPA: dTDP-4-dehydrorhamnose 3,5-epimerase [Candidatus Brocadiia bacterium]|nr:dTDP-4-dehydrorhamnose 3,5-epimerase [Candidatus Brocadiia bacterium]